MEIKKVYVKTRAEFGKQCVFDSYGPNMDEEIKPEPSRMSDYITRSPCHAGVQHSGQLALHECQTVGAESKGSGMFHSEGGWPKEINPRDEEATARFRRRVEKDDDWAPKLRNLFKVMEHSILQNGTVDIHEHYFEDMIPTHLVQPLGLRAANVYADPERPARPVSDISWCPDSGTRIAVSYCFLEFGRLPDYSNTVYIWQVENPNAPCTALEAFCPTVATRFNPRDPSVLASGLMSGQVCNWDIRTGSGPVQLSHRQFSHRDYANAVNWLSTKSNTEFFSTSADGRAMWWDTRELRGPTEVLTFDFESPNEPNIDSSVGVSSLDFGPTVGTKFMFGMENGLVVSGSRKAKSNAEKLGLRFEAHYGPVISVDRNLSNPAVFLSVGDWVARVWAEDTREASLVSTHFLPEVPTGGCWSKSRHSVFYIITSCGVLMAWDLLRTLAHPILTIHLGEDRLTVIAAQEDGEFLAVGDSLGKVFLVESTEALRSFDKKDRAVLSEYFERCSRLGKAVDTRLKEIRLALARRESELPKLEKPAKASRRSRPTAKSTGEVEKQQKHERQSKDRRSVPRDKRKVREEQPELVVAEERYFEVVEKEREKFPVYDDISLQHSLHWSSTSRRQEVKRPEKKDQPDPDRTGEKKSVSVKTGRKKKPRAEEQRKAESSPETRRERPSPSAEPVQLEKPGQETKDTFDTEEGPRRRRRRRCREICRPRICCWGPEAGRSFLRGRRKGGKGRRVERSSEDSSIGEKKPGVGSSKLMDDREDGARRVKYRGKIRILKEMLAPPGELTAEVKRARSEIRARWPGGRCITGRNIQDRLGIKGTALRKVPQRAARKGREKLAKDDRGLRPGRGKDTEIRIADEGRKTKIGAPPVDPCSPRAPRSITKEFEALLGGPITESIEEKPRPGGAYLEEIEAARRRVYPRISEFHSIE